MNPYRYGNFIADERHRNNLIHGIRLGIGLLMVLFIILNVFLIQKDHEHIVKLNSDYNKTIEDMNRFAGSVTSKVIEHEQRLAVQEGNVLINEHTTGTTITATVSMYTASKAETDDTPCIAASGKNICALYDAGQNTCASNDIALGTTIKVEGLGYCTIWDRMNKRYTGTGRIDWFNGKDRQGALKHGVKSYQVTILR